MITLCSSTGTCGLLALGFLTWALHYWWHVGHKWTANEYSAAPTTVIPPAQSPADDQTVKKTFPWKSSWIVSVSACLRCWWAWLHSFILGSFLLSEVVFLASEGTAPPGGFVVETTFPIHAPQTRQERLCFHSLIQRKVCHHQLLFLSRSSGVTDGYAVILILVMAVAVLCKRPTLWWFCLLKAATFIKMLHLWLFSGWFGVI